MTAPPARRTRLRRPDRRPRRSALARRVALRARKGPARRSADDVAKAHAADLATQGEHGVNYLNHWVDEAKGQIFCLVDAANADAANTVHREAHGLVADEIHEVSQG
ncbi:nickel-binding protein [Gryllotalpicola reticulitermitis]|uniref:Nickel-binding protein n=1 Tax=Gryllotalpicola reticulitermitis TaxID=1184153 RepID=A0ABV8Q4P6_9MICO